MNNFTDFFSKDKILSFIRKWYIFILLSIIYIPFIVLIIISFNGESSRGNIITNITGDLTGINYINLFENDEFLNSLFNTFLVVIVVVPVSVGVAIFTCLGMWYSKKKITKFTKGISNGNISIPEIITGISLAIFYSIVWIPLGLDYGYATVVISHISFCIPYAIVSIYPRIMSLKISLVNASNDLGASKTRTFMKVILPYLSPSIISAAIIVTAMSFDDFVITSLVNGNFQTISTSIYLSAKGIKAWIVTFGAILIILFFVGSVVISLRKIYVEKRKEGRKHAFK